MNLVDAVSSHMFYRAPDERIVFRPLGKLGPCYLLTEKQRKARATVQLAYYGILLGSIAFGVIDVTEISRLIVPFGLWVIGNYVLYGLFTIGLARTEAPPKPTSDYVRSLQRQHSLAMGRPLLIAMFYGSIAFSAIGLLGTLF
jgi:hypothetical protein